MRKETEWTLVETLRHARHDWMNDIQIVKGYLALSKLDEAARAADHIIVKAAQESKLCNLGMPGMAELFITFNWSNHLFRLEYEVDDDVASGLADDQLVLVYFSQFFSLIERHIVEYKDHQLFVRFSEADDQLLVRMEWMGALSEQPVFIDQAAALKQESTVTETEDSEILIEATF